MARLNLRRDGGLFGKLNTLFKFQLLLNDRYLNMDSGGGFNNLGPENIRLLVLGAIGGIINLIFSKEHRIFRVLSGIGVAVFSAYILTDPTMKWFELDTTYRDAISALYGLTGYNLLKRIYDASNSATSIIDAFKQITGGKK
jgi:hypothetical protein